MEPSPGAGKPVLEESPDPRQPEGRPEQEKGPSKNGRLSGRAKDVGHQSQKQLDADAVRHQREKDARRPGEGPPLHGLSQRSQPRDVPQADANSPQGAGVRGRAKMTT